jgi:hypothetical protein
MISLQFRGMDKVYKEIDNKILGTQEILSTASKNQIAKAVFTITAKRFIKDFSVASKSNPKKYFHVYEWGATGNVAQKLYTLKRERVFSGNLVVKFEFLKSKKPVPVAPELKSSKGKKSISAKSVFANKAEVMESGKPVRFSTKNYIIFFSKSDGKVNFLPPETVVNIMNPGGKSTTGSFEKFAISWYKTKGIAAVNSSKLIPDIGNAVSRSLRNKGAGRNASKEAIRITTEKYAQGVIEL